MQKRTASIRSILMLVGVITLIISLLLMMATYNVDAGYSRLSLNMENYVQWKRDANDLQIGSDYLTEQVRCFVVTGDRRYLDNYFEEANETRRRDKAVESVRNLMGETEAYNALVSAMGESVDLMDREYYAMRLTVDAYEYDLSEYPQPIQEVELLEEDAVAPKDQQRQTARMMVFDNIYHEKKAAISGNVQACVDAMDEEMDERQASAKWGMRETLRQQRIMIVASILTMVAAIMLLVVLVVKPLLKSVSLIREDQKLPIEGSREFQFLAKEYNIIHDSNQEQKKELAYEATHDILTGVYNRNGYDSIQHSVDWNTSALVLFDLDNFKPVNDTYGHKMGDRVLERTAKTIQNAFRAQDFVCRIGGDEFAVIMTQIGTDSGEMIHEKVKCINEELLQPKDDIPGIHVSCGVAYGARISNFDKLFHEADAALYRVKRNGGGDCEICL